jgi:hypothetical protein
MVLFLDAVLENFAESGAEVTKVVIDDTCPIVARFIHHANQSKIFVHFTHEQNNISVWFLKTLIKNICGFVSSIVPSIS